MRITCWPVAVALAVERVVGRRLGCRWISRSGYFEQEPATAPFGFKVSHLLIWDIRNACQMAWIRIT